MPSLKETRLANLLKLAEKHKFSRQFCDVIGVSPSYFSQIKSGKGVGHKLARQIEANLSLSNGYMDIDHGDKELAEAIQKLPEQFKGPIQQLIYALVERISEDNITK